MKLSFISNYYTHHQAEICNEWHRLTDGNFLFVETEDFSPERAAMGWNRDNDVPFVSKISAEDEKTAISAPDAVILGSAPFDIVRKRLEEGKPVFRYSERIFKKGFSRIKWLPRVFKYRHDFGKYKNLYLLSASAYTAHDYNIHGAFIGRSYKWGYFPETKYYDEKKLSEGKERRKILWCGRFLDWKHPDLAIKLAKRLEDERHDFELEIIGSGDMKECLEKEITENGLSHRVKMSGSMSPEEVRSRMEKVGIYIFTSDFNEGWGAVLNEAMNSGCAVVASHAIGSVPFLINHKENGLIYKNGDFEDFYKKVKFLLENPDLQKEMGNRAYHTITDLWNGKVAAERFIEMVDEIQKHGYCDLYESGPCSRAKALRNDWFR